MAAPKKAKSKAADRPAIPTLRFSHAEPGTMRHRIESVLVYLYHRTEQAGFEGAIAPEDVSRDTGLPLALIRKIARHLEGHGMLEYDHGALDLTVQGMIEAESMQQPKPAAAPKSLQPPPPKR